MTESFHRGSAAIVGSRGFIGRTLERRLLSEGVTVIPVDKGDMERPGMSEQVARAATVFWAASTINPAIAATDPARVAADRAAFGEFLDVFEQAAHGGRLVYFSSGGTVYGRGTPPFHESSPTVPMADYGRAKLALENDVLTRPFPSTVVRIANAYGPGQHPAPGQGVISHWLTALASHQPIKVIGSLDVVRDYLFIDDLVDALLRIHRSAEVPAVLNLGSGTPTSLGQVLAAVEDVANDHSPVIAHTPSRSFDLDRVWLDTSLAEAALGWRARTDIRAGVEATWAWVLAGAPAMR